MARIPDGVIERLKTTVSVQRLAEARGVVLSKHGGALGRTRQPLRHDLLDGDRDQGLTVAAASAVQRDLEPDVPHARQRTYAIIALRVEQLPSDAKGTRMIDDMIVVDGVVHCYNWTPENYVIPQAAIASAAEVSRRSRRASTSFSRL